MINAQEIAEGTTLSQRQLNRALLARQHLLRRASMPVGDMITHLVGLQSQVPGDPFIALWSRIGGFTPDALSTMMMEKTAVRGSLMRGTIHLVTTADYLTLQPFTASLHQRAFPTTARGRLLPREPLPEILEAGRVLFRQNPMTMKALGDALAERWSIFDPSAMAQANRFLLPLIQITPRGVWRASHQATWAHIEDWVHEPVAESADFPTTIRRYLAAFGPATVGDMQAWSGVTGMRAIVEAIRDELVIYRNEQGQELFDLPGAPLPNPETAAPVRFLPGFDNVLLSHKDRTRIISEDRRRAIGSNNGMFQSTYLVDGFVAGTWLIETTKDRATVIL